MKLAFRNKYSFGYSEKEVPLKINMWTIEAIGKEFGVEFYQVQDIAKRQNFDFMVQLLHKSYLTACHELFDKGKLKKRKPEYTVTQAILWYEHLNQTSQKEVMQMLQEFSTGLSKASKKKVKDE